MTREEIIQAIFDDKTMPFIQPDQLAGIVEFVIKNYRPSLPSDLDEAAKEYLRQYNESEYGNGGDDWDDDICITFKAGAEWMAGKKEDESHE